MGVVFPGELSAILSAGEAGKWEPSLPYLVWKMEKVGPSIIKEGIIVWPMIRACRQGVPCACIPVAGHPLIAFASSERIGGIGSPISKRPSCGTPWEGEPGLFNREPRLPPEWQSPLGSRLPEGGGNMPSAPCGDELATTSKSTPNIAPPLVATRDPLQIPWPGSSRHRNPLRGFDHSSIGSAQGLLWLGSLRVPGGRPCLYSRVLVIRS